MLGFLESPKEPKYNNWMYEDELPKMTNKQYSEWYKTSEVVSGVRMGYPVDENGNLI